MRYIKTTNNLVEFIEANNEEKILSVRAFQFGELYFQIKNGKVTFYLNDQENPWRNDVWTINIPFELDGVEYDNEGDASAALSAIMNDSFQEQLDELKEGIAAEEARAQEAEAQLDDKIDDETARAIAQENRLQDEITELSGTVATFDNRITNVENGLSALTEDVNDEIARSTAKDAEHDALISGLTNSLNNEISRATSAETILHNEILDERNRALAAEEDLDDKIDSLDDKVDAEILRSTEKDAQHDAQISALTTNLQNEIQRATTAENSLRDDLDDEIARSIEKDNQLEAKLDQEIADREADVDAEEARAKAAEDALDDKLDAEILRSTNKDTEHDNLISGITEGIDDLETVINNEISRATSAETILHNEILDERNRALAAESALTSADNAMVQRITALEVGKADKSDVYTKAESDAKYATKEYVSGNTYTKAEIATMMADKADKLNAVSTALYNSQNKTIDFKNIYGNVIASVDARDFIKDGMVDNAEIINNNLVITFNTDAGKEAISVSLTDIFDPNNYYTKAETDEAIADAIDDIDFSNYYTKSEVDASQAAQDNKIDAISGKVDTISANTYTKSEVDASQTAQDNKINAISGDVQTLSGKVDTISGDVITLGGDVQTLSGEVQTISGSAITSGEVQTMIDEAVSGKQDTLTAGRAIDITNNVVSFTLPISAGTGEKSVVEGYQTKAYSDYCHAEGRGSIAGVSNSNKGYSSHAEGENTTASGNMSHSEGNNTKATGDSSHAEGNYTNAYGSCSHAEGSDTNAYNDYEHASGKFNKSTKLNSRYGSGGNTLFSVGNGVRNTNLHNTFEVRQNGDIYIADTSQITGTGSGETEGHNFYDVPMIKLQDALGQGGGGVTSGQVQTMIDNSLVGYQEELSAGTNVQINNNVISATDTKYTAGDGISISNQNVISTVTKFWCGDEAAYNQIAIKDPNTVYMIHE